MDVISFPLPYKLIYDLYVMNEKEINFKPSVEQLKTDMKKEAFVGFLYILFFAIALVLMKQYIIPLFFPLFLLVLFYRYFKFKGNIEDRFIRIENNQVIQETPDLPRGMRLINLEVYTRAKFKSNKIFLIENQGISIGMCIDLKGYPEKSLIFATIENRIKNPSKIFARRGNGVVFVSRLRDYVVHGKIENANDYLLLFFPFLPPFPLCD